MNTLHPCPEHRFAFGLWTVGHRGGDPFGEVLRPPIEPCEFVHRLGDLGVWGVSLHDDDLVPPGSTPAERGAVVGRFRKALDATGVVVSMASTNLFSHPVFKDGAFTASDRDVRRFAIQKAMRAIDLGAELGARIHVFGGGREGAEAVAAKAPFDVLARYREAIDFLCGYVRDRGYDTRFALEPKANGPRGDALLPTVGHALALIATLDQPEMVGLNPEVAHEAVAGLSVYHGVAQAIDAGKLLHIDLNAHRHNQDLRFGSGGLRDAFFIVKLLEESGYDGPRHFDCRPWHVEDSDGAWEFARGCMRTYLALAAKARRFADDLEIQDAIAECGATALAEATIGPYTSDAAAALAAEPFDTEVLAKQDNRTEHLDQLVTDLIMGLR
jgi:xylose isomerase